MANKSAAAASISETDPVVVINQLNDAHISESTRRLITDLAKTAQVEVLIVHPLEGDVPEEDPAPVKPRPARTTMKKQTQPPKPPANPKGKEKTVAARLRELISQNLSDEKIWPIIQKEYNLESNKKSYIAGQRKAMEKKRALVN